MDNNLNDNVVSSNRLKCPNCGYDNNSEYKFCINCGVSFNSNNPKGFDNLNVQNNNGDLQNNVNAQSVLANKKPQKKISFLVILGIIASFFISMSFGIIGIIASITLFIFYFKDLGDNSKFSFIVVIYKVFAGIFILGIIGFLVLFGMCLLSF